MGIKDWANQATEQAISREQRLNILEQRVNEQIGELHHLIEEFATTMAAASDLQSKIASTLTAAARLEQLEAQANRTIQAASRAANLLAEAAKTGSGVPHEVLVSIVSAEAQKQVSELLAVQRPTQTWYGIPSQYGSHYPYR